MWIRGLYDKGTWRKRSFENLSLQDSSGVWASFSRDDRIQCPPNASACYGNAQNTASGGFSTRRKLQASSRDSSPLRECLQPSASMSPRSNNGTYSLEDTWQLGRRAHCHGQDSSTARDCLVSEPPVHDTEAWVADRSSRAAEEIEVSLGARRPRGSRSRWQSSEGVSAVVFGSATTAGDELIEAKGNLDGSTTRCRKTSVPAESSRMKDALRYAVGSDELKSVGSSDFKRGRRFLPCGQSPAVPHAFRLEFSGVDQRLSHINCPDSFGAVPSAGRPTYFGPMGESRIGWDIEPISRINWCDDGAGQENDRPWEGYAGLPSPIRGYESNGVLHSDRHSRRPSRRNADQSLDSCRSTNSRGMHHSRNRSSSPCSGRSYEKDRFMRSLSRRRYHEPPFSGPRLGPRSGEGERWVVGFENSSCPSSTMEAGITKHNSGSSLPFRHHSEDERPHYGTKFSSRRTPAKQSISSFDVPPWVEQPSGDTGDDKAFASTKYFSKHRRLIQYEPSASWVSYAQLAGSSNDRDEALASSTAPGKYHSQRRRLIQYEPSASWVGYAQLVGSSSDRDEALASSTAPGKYHSQRRRLIQYEPSVSWGGPAQLVGGSDDERDHGGGTKYHAKGKLREHLQLSRMPTFESDKIDGKARRHGCHSHDEDSCIKQVPTSEASRKNGDAGANSRKNEFGPASNIETIARFPSPQNQPKDASGKSMGTPSPSLSPERAHRASKSSTSMARRTNWYT